MCGIAGFLNPEGQAADRAIVERMIATIRHRGPDGSGVRLDGRLALGHRRLSIIDVDGGAQPMSNEDGTVWVSFNGEIYNELELRAGLKARGHRYGNESDTESLVHLYEEEGPAFVDKLNGMFALALWDSKRGRLVLARDRMGQKPLLYAWTASGGLVFGSEPKAILAHPEISRRLDPDGLARYLFFEYLPAPHSIWSGIRKLPCAHRLVVENGQGRLERYWTPDFPEEHPQEPIEQGAKRLWGMMTAAAARHRRSDVPLGVFLSGGVDSSSVAAALAESQDPSTIRTYSIGFADKSYDESGYARRVARHLGTDHRERQFRAEDVLRLLPEVADWLDEPFGDASILPTHLLCRFAREEITVALGGDGADELWAGYPTFTAYDAARLYRRLPKLAHSAVGAAARRLPVDPRNFSFDFKVRQFLRGASEPMPLAHQRWLGSFSGSEIQRLLVEPPTIAVEEEWVKRVARWPQPDPLSQALWMYQDAYLPEDILTKVDRASMARGLEVRAPLLDAELVDHVQRLPIDWKYRRGKGKRLLKMAVAHRLPDEILKRPKKGFGIPSATWLRGPLAGLVEDELGADRLRREGTFRVSEVRRLVVEHQSGAANHRKPLWTLLMFQLWRRKWLD